MVPFQTIPPSEPFGRKDFFDSLVNNLRFYTELTKLRFRILH